MIIAICGLTSLQSHLHLKINLYVIVIMALDGVQYIEEKEEMVKILQRNCD